MQHNNNTQEDREVSELWYSMQHQHYHQQHTEHCRHTRHQPPLIHTHNNTTTTTSTTTLPYNHTLKTPMNQTELHYKNNNPRIVRTKTRAKYFTTINTALQPLPGYGIIHPVYGKPKPSHILNYLSLTTHKQTPQQQKPEHTQQQQTPEHIQQNISVLENKNKVSSKLTAQLQKLNNNNNKNNNNNNNNNNQELIELSLNKHKHDDICSPKRLSKKQKVVQITDSIDINLPNANMNVQNKDMKVQIVEQNEDTIVKYKVNKIKNFMTKIPHTSVTIVNTIPSSVLDVGKTDNLNTN